MILDIFFNYDKIIFVTVHYRLGPEWSQKRRRAMGTTGPLAERFHNSLTEICERNMSLTSSRIECATAHIRWFRYNFGPLIQGPFFNIINNVKLAIVIYIYLFAIILFLYISKCSRAIPVPRATQ